MAGVVVVDCRDIITEPNRAAYSSLDINAWLSSGGITLTLMVAPKFPPFISGFDMLPPMSRNFEIEVWPVVPLLY